MLTFISFLRQPLVNRNVGRHHCVAKDDFYLGVTLFWRWWCSHWNSDRFHIVSSLAMERGIKANWQPPARNILQAKRPLTDRQVDTQFLVILGNLCIFVKHSCYSRAEDQHRNDWRQVCRPVQKEPRQGGLGRQLVDGKAAPSLAPRPVCTDSYHLGTSLQWGSPTHSCLNMGGPLFKDWFVCKHLDDWYWLYLWLNHPQAW